MGSILCEIIDFFPIYLILPPALGPGIYSDSNRNEYQKIFLEIKALLTPETGDFSASCDPTA
jgi:hypothetical protein